MLHLHVWNLYADSSTRPPHQSSTSSSDRIKDGEVRALSDEETFHLREEFEAMMAKLVPLMDKELYVDHLKLFLQAFCDVRTGQPYVEAAIYQPCISTAEILKALYKHDLFNPVQLPLLTIIVEKYGSFESRHLLIMYKSKLPRPIRKRSRIERTDEEIKCSTKELKLEIKGDSDKLCLEDVEKTYEDLVRVSIVILNVHVNVTCGPQWNNI